MPLRRMWSTDDKKTYNRSIVELEEDKDDLDA